MRKLLIGVAILVALLILVGVSRLGGSEATTVQVTPAATHDLRRSILASGRIAYREDVEMRSEVIGQVVEVGVEEGDHVNKGDVVLRLNPETFQAEVEQREASVRQQQIGIKVQKLTIDNMAKQWRRKKELAESGVIDVSTFDNATNALAIARLKLKSQKQLLKQATAQLRKAKERLSKTVINAPMDGMVTGVFVEEGETVISGTRNIAGSTLATIADPSVVLGKVYVDEADIANVGVGQSARVYAAAYPDRPLEGVVESVATTARRVSGRQGLSFEVEIRLKLGTGGKPGAAEDTDLPLRPGMSARAEIFTSRAEDALAVPIQAVQYASDATRADDDKTSAYLFLAKNGKAQKTPVKLGISTDRYQQISEGLAKGDAVITGPVSTLRHMNDGMEITVEPSDGASDKDDGTASDDRASD